jgi:hypothetical protein
MRDFGVVGIGSPAAVASVSMGKRYRKQLDSHTADIKSIGSEHPGAITAALFPAEFVCSRTPQPLLSRDARRVMVQANQVSRALLTDSLLPSSPGEKGHHCLRPRPFRRGEPVPSAPRRSPVALEGR